MKKVILNVGMALLAMGLLTACSSGNDVVEVPDQPKQEQPKPDNPKEDEDEPETPEPEDSMVVDMLPQTHAIQLTEEQREFAKKNNDFTFNLYRAVNDAQQERKSIVTSPLSVTYVMGMLNDGAAGIPAGNGTGDAPKQKKHITRDMSYEQIQALKDAGVWTGD